MNVIILPRTAAGRDLLRLLLPAVDWSTGLLPDGSSIYDCDWDETAVWVEHENAQFDAFLKEQGRTF